MSRFFWQEENIKKTFPIVSRKEKSKQLSDITVNHSNVKKTLDQFRTVLFQTFGKSKTLNEKFKFFSQFFYNHDSLVDLNITLSQHLFQNLLGGNKINYILSSDLFNYDFLENRINRIIINSDEIVESYNDKITYLEKLGVQVPLRYFNYSYIPLNVVCPNDKRRVALKKSDKNKFYYECSCGKNEIFIDSHNPLKSISKLNWSFDVSLPLLLNSYVSGIVVGESSSIYGIVLNNAIKEVLKETPVSMILPVDYKRENLNKGLIYNYFSE